MNVYHVECKHLNFSYDSLTKNIYMVINNDMKYNIYFNFIDSRNSIDVLEMVHYDFSNKKFVIHNENGPAIIRYHYDNGNIYSVEYCINYKLHRIYGPAIINYVKNGSIDEVRWYYKDYNYTNKVKHWIVNNNLKSWKHITENDFNRMWVEIL